MIDSFVADFIPNTMLGNTLLIGLIVASLYFVSKGADMLVDAAVDIARDLGLPQVIIGATVVSLGTTSPETAVSVMGAVQGNGGLAIGNGVGSVICNLALILGFTITVTRVPINRHLINRQALVTLLSAVLLLVMANLAPNRMITRPMGVFLVFLLICYMYLSYHWSRTSPPPAAPESEPEDARALGRALGMLAVGLIVLIAACKVLIPSVTLAAERVGVPQSVIAATLVAFGTSLPEFMTAISSIRKGVPELTLGNVIGANVLNILFVIGLSAVAMPLRIEPIFISLQGPAMLGLLVLFSLFAYTTRRHFRTWQGVVLLVGYAGFILIQFIVDAG